MTTVGITGHQRLPGGHNSWDWVKHELVRVIGAVPPPLLGVSSLAVGADQLFAEVVLNVGGTIEAIIPFPTYEEKFQAEAKANYQRLRDLCSRIEVLPPAASDEISYLEAGKRVVDLSELVVAVWDGEPAKGLGGTADIVRYAQGQRRQVIHINPISRIVRPV